MSLKHSHAKEEEAWIVKCTDLPQFDALAAQAELFRTDDKLHLRNLCNDTARCAGLTAIYHFTPTIGMTTAMVANPNSLVRMNSAQSSVSSTLQAASSVRKIVLDYSRQRVTGETMELLFDLADAVHLTDRMAAMQTGLFTVNATEKKPVLHHVLRMPATYPIVLDPQLDEDGDSYDGLLSNSHDVAEEPSFEEDEEERSFGRRGDLRSSRPRISSYESVGSTGSSLFHPTPTSSAAPNGRLDGAAVLAQVSQMRRRIRDFSQAIRTGSQVGVTGKLLKHVLCVGVGPQVAPHFVAAALEADPSACKASAGRDLRWLSNVDPVEFGLCTTDWDPAETLVLVHSRTFGTAETTLNLRTVQAWLSAGLAIAKPGLKPAQIYAAHVFCITAHPARCKAFWIPEENVFLLPDWVVERYSLFSPMGLLPLSLQYSYEIMQQVMDGAHDMDEHFFHTPLRDNLPVIMGLLAVWNTTFLGYPARAVLPYAAALSSFPAWLQQLEMASNGKRVALDGTALLHPSCEVVLGGAGTTIQHTMMQLLHQGRVVPADFIGFMESTRPVALADEAISNHDELMTNFFAQPDALAYGKTLMDLVQEGIPERLREHFVVTGNRPSTSLLMTAPDPHSIGQLLALYEHRTAVQGFIWGLNSFDQYGVELGKTLAKQVRGTLSASRKTGASVQGFNQSTSTLLEHYLAHGRDASTKKYY